MLTAILTQTECAFCHRPLRRSRRQILRSEHSFCDKACNGAYKKLSRAKTSCGFCNKELDVQPSRLRKGKTFHCSDACRNRAKQQRVESECGHCRKPIIVRPHRLRKTGVAYCSKDCAVIGRTTYKTIPCDGCGKPIKRQPWQLARNEKSYCSRKCYPHTKLTGSTSPHWKGGSRAYARTLKGPDPYCAICGWNRAALDIHHIIPVAKGGSHTGDNLVVLCPNDHRLADRGILSEQELRDANTRYHQTITSTRVGP